MADERTCYAGDLGSDALGKRVRYTLRTVPPSLRTLTVTKVEHRMRLVGSPQTLITGVAGNPDDPTDAADVTVQQLASNAIVEVLP